MAPVSEAATQEVGGEVGAEALDLESRRIARYLLGVDPSPELIERYRRAHELLSLGPPTPRDRAVLGLIGRHAWTLPYLDAASGVLRSDSLLRRKLLLMLALLEASPEHFEQFEAESPGRLRSVGRLLRLGVVSALQIAVGVALWPLVLARARLRRS